VYRVKKEGAFGGYKVRQIFCGIHNWLCRDDKACSIICVALLHEPSEGPCSVVRSVTHILYAIFIMFAIYHVSVGGHREHQRGQESRRAASDARQEESRQVRVFCDLFYVEC
jgi:hypothetical protein